MRAAASAARVSGPTQRLVRWTTDGDPSRRQRARNKRRTRSSQPARVAAPPTAMTTICGRRREPAALLDSFSDCQHMGGDGKLAGAATGMHTASAPGPPVARRRPRSAIDGSAVTVAGKADFRSEHSSQPVVPLDPRRRLAQNRRRRNAVPRAPTQPRWPVHGSTGDPRR